MTEKQIGYSIGPISEADDVTGTYGQMHDKDQENEALGWLDQIVEDNQPVNQPTNPQNQGQGGNPAPSADNAPQSAQSAPAVSSGGQPQNWGQQVLAGLGAAAEGVGAVAKDVGGGIVEAPAQIVGGVMDAVHEVDQFLTETTAAVAPWMPALQIFDPDTGAVDIKAVSQEEYLQGINEAENTLIQKLTPSDADTNTGAFIRSTAQFLTGFLPASKAVQGLKAGAITKAALAGALADATVFDPHEDRLSTFLNEIPALGAIVPNYLADNNPENESTWEGRLKNVVEGAGLGLATDGLLKAFKYYKAQRTARKAAPQATGATDVAARDVIKDAAHDQIVHEVTDEDLIGLGDPQGPMLVAGDLDETSATAFKRIRESAERVAANETKVKASERVMAVVEKVKAEAGLDDTATAFDEALNNIRSGKGIKASTPKRPIATLLKEMGGVDPKSKLAAELRNRGITAKTHPGLYRTKPTIVKTPQGETVKEPLRALDNIPASEVERLAHLGAEDGYIPEQVWIDALDDEVGGKVALLPDEQRFLDEQVAFLEDMEEQLFKLDIDLDKMDNAAVMARMEQVEAERMAFEKAGEQVPDHARAIDISDLDDDLRPLDADGNRQPPKGKIFINHARIASGDDVKAVIQELADADAKNIEARKGGVKSADKVIRESSKEYQDLNDLIGRAPGPMSAAEAVAARRLLTASAEQLVELARRAEAPDASKADLFNFRRATSVHYAIQAEVMAARTETARALQSWSIPVGASKARTDAINDMIEQAGGAGDLQSLAKAFVQMGDNPKAINSMAHELNKGRFKKAAFQIWINGLLSSPKTHVVNALSNAMVAAYAIPERYLSAAISKTFYNGEIDFGEVSAQAFGLKQGIRDGFRLVAHGSKAADIGDLNDVFEAFVKADMGPENAISAEAFGLKPTGGIGWGIDMMGKLVNAPGQALATSDKFFKSIGYRSELNALAYRQAFGEGLEGEDLAKRVADIIADPPANLKADAIDAAHYQTFTKPLGKTGQAVQNVIRQVPGARLVVPFIRTPTNIFKYSLERTPLAYMSSKIRADIRAGGARAAQAHARVAMGSMIMMVIADMTMEGVITGNGSLDPAIRRQQMSTGWQPYSVKIGDRYYSYKRLDPIGMIMGLAADTAEIIGEADEEEAGKVVMAGAIALANNLASKTYMSGIYDFIGAVDPGNPTNSPEKYLADFTGSMVPYSSFLRSIATANDPILRETREGSDDPVGAYLDQIVNNVKRGIPGLSDTLPPRRDLWGEEINRSAGLGWAFDFISPIASRVDDPDPVDQAIIDNKVPVSMPQRNIQGVPLSAEEYSQFVELAGRGAKKQLDILVQSPAFKQASDGPDGMKAELIRNVISSHRKKAAQLMLMQSPTLRERLIRNKKTQAQTLIGNN